MHTPNFDLPSSIYQSEWNRFYCHMHRRNSSRAAYQPPGSSMGKPHQIPALSQAPGSFATSLPPWAGWMGSIPSAQEQEAFSTPALRLQLYRQLYVCQWQERSGMPFSGMPDTLFRFYHAQHLHKVLRSCLWRAHSPKERDVSGI